MSVNAVDESKRELQLVGHLNQQKQSAFTNKKIDKTRTNIRI